MPDLSSLLDELANRGTPRGADEVLSRARADVARRRRRDRRRLASFALVVGVAAAVMSVVLVRTANTRRSQRVIAAPETTAQALRSQGTDADLVWAEGRRLVLGDPVSGAKREIGDPIAGCCGAIVREGRSLFVGAADGIYRLDPLVARWTKITDGQIVFPATSTGQLFVAATSPTSPNGSNIRLITTAGAMIGGPWQVPGGYWLTYPPRATTVGLMVESPPNSPNGTLAVWDPATGSVDRVLGRYGHIIDTYTSRGRTTVAWTRGGCGTEVCNLVLTDLATGRSRDVAPPAGDVGFIGGGAFSPDGTSLAAFAVLNEGFVGGPGQGRRMQLVIVDVSSGALSAIGGSVGEFGEEYGFATWAPGGQWVFFGAVEGRGESIAQQHVGAHRVGTTDAVELKLPANYSMVAVNASHPPLTRARLPG